MRPYLAIIVDSFRAAIASQVFVIVMVCEIGVLLAFAAIGYRIELGWRVEQDEFRDIARLIIAIDDGARAKAPSPGKQIADQMDPKLRSSLSDLIGEPIGWYELLDLQRSLAKELTRLIEEDKLYDEKAFARVMVRPAGMELAGQPRDELSEQQRRRLDRLYLEAAFPDALQESPPKSITWTMFGAAFPSSMPGDEEDVQDILKKAVAFMIDWVVAGIAMFVAVLLAASNVPRMLEPGAIELLLSRPITRAATLVAEFVAACSSITLHASVIIGGLWLVMAIRYGVVEPILLLLILVIVFLFAVYYSVTMLSGLLFRNTIISIVLTILFWMATVVVGLRDDYEDNLLDGRYVYAGAQVNDTPLVVTRQGIVKRWQPDGRTWEYVKTPDTAGIAMMGPSARIRTRGPVYLPKSERVLLYQPGIMTFGEIPIIEIEAGGDWRSTRGPGAPEGTFCLFATDADRVMAVARDGVFRLVRSGETFEREDAGDERVDPEAPLEGAEAAGDEDGDSGDLPSSPAPLPEGEGSSPGPDADAATAESATAETPEPEPAVAEEPRRRVILANRDDRFRKVFPLSLGTAAAAAYHAPSRRLAVLNGKILRLLQLTADGAVAADAQFRIEDGVDRPLVALGADFLALAGRESADVFLYAPVGVDADKKPKRIAHVEANRDKERTVVSLSAAPHGSRLAVLFSDDRMELRDAVTGRPVDWPIRGQGVISYCQFREDGSLAVSRSLGYLDIYDEGGQRRENYSPTLSLLDPEDYPDLTYFYVLRPLSYVSPSQTEFDRTINYLLLQRTDFYSSREEKGKIQHSPWTPLIKSAVFILVMLGLGIWHFTRLDL